MIPPAQLELFDRLTMGAGHDSDQLDSFQTSLDHCIMTAASIINSKEFHHNQRKKKIFPQL
jgi:hypothetical protein